MDATAPPGAVGLSGARHEFEEHTSELQIRLEAPSLPDLFVEAGRALAEVMSARNGTAASTDGQNPLGHSQSVHVRAQDRNALLVEWLNELIFRAETERRIFTDFRIDRLTDTELTAAIRGPEVELSQTPVKAATMHGIAIRENGGRFFATVVLDV